MRKICVIIMLLVSPSCFGQSPAQATAAIGDVLDAYHAAAAAADWNTYFDLMSENGVFLGTDADERWTKPEFRAYAGNRSGWLYRPVRRNINITPDGMSAWFDEILDSASYGTSRGTGVLIRTDDGWKISQYHLTLPIPNELAGKLTDEIKAFESEQ
ncbi:MAG: nuclear transport factor 2 family protein [Gammaproteobacteria bacterium]|nr:nuclear transport factor 2 family protein [Gammaproteobacteria bacterium]MDP6534774.1 nuclear transport factor 2 family protein [Gammaproteobacteria bacterium]MDP6731865.1 nuclear transport factor 2 family protein [Gammaproteobacteria bacterium]